LIDWSQYPFTLSAKTLIIAKLGKLQNQLWQMLYPKKWITFCRQRVKRRTIAARSGTVSARVVHLFERHPFSEPPASAGELLHTPQRISAFITTVLLSAAGNVLFGI